MQNVLMCQTCAVKFHLGERSANVLRCGVALTFFRRYKRSDLRFCACAIYVKSSMCSGNTKHLWYKYYRLFVRMYITSQQSYLSQINTRQTSFEAYFDRQCKSRDSDL